MSSRTNTRRRPAPPPPPPPKKSNRTWIILGGIAMLVVVAVIIAVVASGGSDTGSGGKGGGGSSAVEVAPVKVTGTPLPDFPSGGTDKAIGSTMPTLTGQSLFDGSDMTIAPTGKPMAIVYLAHWCPHCQAEVPRIVALAKAGKLDGIGVFAVAAAGQKSLPNYPPSSWLEGADWPYPTMVDSADSTAAAAYGLTGYPYFMLVDAQGKVVDRAEGELADADILAAVKALVAGKSPDLTGGASSSK